MPIKINSTGGGSVSIDVPSTGGTYTLTAPANNATIFTTDGGAITGNVAFTSNNVTIGGQTASPFGAKNKLINGDFKIDQRNAGSSNTYNGFGVDRWYFGPSQNLKGTWGQNYNYGTAPTGFPSYWGWTTGATPVTLGAGDYFTVWQGIEGYNFYDLAYGTSSAKTMTLSFWVKCSLTGPFGGVLSNYAGTRAYPFTYTISAADTWTYITVSIPGDTSGTWVGFSNAGAAFLLFSLGTGTTYSATANSWVSGSYYSSTGGTNVLGTASAKWAITGVQLEVGPVATPFEWRHYQHELALCQRYYEQSNPLVAASALYNNNDSNVYTVGWNYSGIYGGGAQVFYKQTKRAAPTVNLYTAGIGGYSTTSSGYVNFYQGSWSSITGSMNVNGVTGFNISNQGGSTGICYLAFNWTSSCEI